MGYDASPERARLVSGSFWAENDTMSWALLTAVRHPSGYRDAIVIETAGRHDRLPSDGPFRPSLIPRPVYYSTASAWAFDPATREFLIGTACGIRSD